ASFIVTLPASEPQGDTAQGTVTISAPPANDIIVHLFSNSPFVTVPATVLIHAGQTSATFTITLKEAGEYIGTQGGTITAHVDNWTDGSGSMSVTDQSPADWPTFGNGAGHTGYQAITTGNRTYEAGWSKSYSPSTAGGLQQVAVKNDIVYVTP